MIHALLRTVGLPTNWTSFCSYGSAPTKLGRDVLQERFQDVCAVFDSELVGDREQQRVGGSDRLILRELLDEPLGVSGVRLAEARLTAVEEADLVLRVAFAAEVSAVEVVDDREDAAADRHAGHAGMAGIDPGLTE